MITMWNGFQANGAIIGLWRDITFTTERKFQIGIMLGFFVEQIVEMIMVDITSNCLGGAGLMVHSWEADWTFMVSGIMHIITPPAPYYTIQYHTIPGHIRLYITPPNHTIYCQTIHHSMPFCISCPDICVKMFNYRWDLTLQENSKKITQLHWYMG